MTEVDTGVRRAMPTVHDDATDRARLVFAGLSPRLPDEATNPMRSARDRRERAAERAELVRRARAGAFATMPVVLTGALAVGLGLTGPVDAAQARTPQQPGPRQTPHPDAFRTALGQWGAAIMPGALTASSVASTAAPATYEVQPGDTVSSIAQSYGLSTASVLALNGLSWRSMIFPGQVLRLTAAPVKTTGAPTPTTAGGQYTVGKGDTVSSIAHRFGVSTRAVLDANQLTTSSIIYPGQQLTIPGAGSAEQPRATRDGAAVALDAASATSASDASVDAEEKDSPADVVAMDIAEKPTLPVAPRVTTAPPSGGGSESSGPITPLTSEMREHARTIISVGRQLGVPEYGIVIALATAMQESTLRNLSWGDRDSVGLFQQRPSSGWGTAADLQIPSHAAKLFYVGRSGYTRGLLDIPGWQNMTLTQAAQAVQISAYPNHYAKWEASAWSWYYELT